MAHDLKLAAAWVAYCDGKPLPLEDAFLFASGYQAAVDNGASLKPTMQKHASRLIEMDVAAAAASRDSFVVGVVRASSVERRVPREGGERRKQYDRRDSQDVVKAELLRMQTVLLLAALEKSHDWPDSVEELFAVRMAAKALRKLTKE